MKVSCSLLRPGALYGPRLHRLVPARIPIMKRLQSTASYNYTEESSDKYNFQSPRNANSQVSCTILGQNGKVTAVSHRFSRAQFLAENGLHPRDLRSMSSRISLIPSILVRPKCILVNMLDLQAVIKHNQVMILDAKRDTSKLSLLLYDLENRLESKEQLHLATSSSNLPYELRALESILQNTVSSLEIDLKAQLGVLNEILHHLEDHIDRDLLKDLLIKSKKVSQFLQKTRLVRDVLSDILESDEDLCEMYLSEKHQGIEREVTDHAEAELLLESYYKQLDEIVQQGERVATNVKTTEEIVNIMLDSNRNALMLMELKITVGTLGFTFGMFFAALYGMNLENFIEESPYGFWSVSAVITALTVAVTWFNSIKLKEVRRVAILTASGKRKKQQQRHIRRAEWKWLVDRS